MHEDVLKPMADNVHVNRQLFTPLETTAGPVLRQFGLQPDDRPNVLPRFSYHRPAGSSIGYFFEFWIDKAHCEWEPDRLIVPSDPQVLGEMGAFIEQPDTRLRVAFIHSVALTRVMLNIEQYLGYFEMMATLLYDRQALANWAMNVPSKLIQTNDIRRVVIERTIGAR